MSFITTIMELSILEVPSNKSSKKDLHLIGHKIQLMQELKRTDHLKCQDFVEWILQNQEYHISNKAYFQLDMYVNKQIC